MSDEKKTKQTIRDAMREKRRVMSQEARREAGPMGVASMSAA